MRNVIRFYSELLENNHESFYSKLDEIGYDTMDLSELIEKLKQLITTIENGYGIIGDDKINSVSDLVVSLNELGNSLLGEQKFIEEKLNEITNNRKGN